MIRKGNRTLRTRVNVFNSRNFYMMYFVLCFGAVFRLYNISSIDDLALSEIGLFNEFDIINKGRIPFDNKPIISRVILLLYHNFIRAIVETEDKNITYILRLSSAIISSLFPPLVMLILYMHNIHPYIVLLTGLIVAFEPSFIIMSKLCVPDTTFIFWSLLAIVVCEYQKINNSALFAQFQIILTLFGSLQSYNGYIIILLTFIIRNHYTEVVIRNLIPLLAFSLTVLLAIRVNFSNMPEDQEEDMHFLDKYIVAFTRYSSFFRRPKKIASVFYWPLSKLKPVPVYVNRSYRFIVVNGFLTTPFIFISCLLNITDRYSLAFLFSLLNVWLFDNIYIPSYQFSFIMGVISTARLFSKISYFGFLTVTILLCLTLFVFLTFAPWVLGIELKDKSYHKNVDIWNLNINFD